MTETIQAIPTQSFILTGISSDAICQKSTPLLMLCLLDFSLIQLKLVDVYLSRINSHCPESRLVRFSKKELEEHLGVSKINTRELKEEVKGLLHKSIDQDIDLRYRGINLFSLAECEPDPQEKNQIMITLACNKDLEMLFFNVENIRYFKYTLESVEKLTSMYSYRMYMYLLPNQFRGSWTEPIDVVRQKLKCPPDVYQKFPDFNRKVLKASQQELDEKSRVTFDYEVVKQWRTATDIRFTIRGEIPGTTNRGGSIMAPVREPRTLEAAHDRMTLYDDIEVAEVGVGIDKVEVSEVYELLGHNVTKADIETVLRYVSDWNHTSFREADVTVPIKEARNNFLLKALTFHMKCRASLVGADGMVDAKHWISTLELYRGHVGTFGLL